MHVTLCSCVHRCGGWRHGYINPSSIWSQQHKFRGEPGFLWHVLFSATVRRSLGLFQKDVHLMWTCHSLHVSCVFMWHYVAVCIDAEDEDVVTSTPYDADQSKVSTGVFSWGSWQQTRSLLIYLCAMHYRPAGSWLMILYCCCCDVHEVLHQCRGSMCRIFEMMSGSVYLCGTAGKTMLLLFTSIVHNLVLALQMHDMVVLPIALSCQF